MQVEITQKSRFNFAWYNDQIGKKFDVVRQIKEPINGFVCIIDDKNTCAFVPHNHVKFIPGLKRIIVHPLEKKVKSKTKKKHSVVDIEQLKIDCERMSISDISRKHGIARTTLLYHIKKHGLKPKDGRKIKYSNCFTKTYSLSPNTIKIINRLSDRLQCPKSEIVDIAVEQFFNRWRESNEGNF